MHKYEAKIKRRDADIKEKTQELRKLRADTANAKLQVDKIASERDSYKAKSDSMEATERDLTDQMSELEVQLSVARKALAETKERLDLKEEELEAKSTEVAVLKVTVEGCKASMKLNNNSEKNNFGGFGDNEDDGGNGWEVEDEIVLPGNGNDNNENGFDAIAEMAAVKVELQKAQAACETLTEQLVNAETAKEKFESEAIDLRKEAEIARKAKETALEEKSEQAKKHEVLASYFNQREAELQKQLGVQTQRLDEVETGSESVSKKLNLLYDELESSKSQCKSLSQELEDQVLI